MIFDAEINLGFMEIHPSSIVLARRQRCRDERTLVRYSSVFVISIPESFVNICVSQGRTRAEATGNVREAIEGYIKSLRKHGEPVPPSILEEIIEVAIG